jgi:hypothetical protein
MGGGSRLSFQGETTMRTPSAATPAAEAAGLTRHRAPRRRPRLSAVLKKLVA